MIYVLFAILLLLFLFRPTLASGRPIPVEVEDHVVSVLAELNSGDFTVEEEGEQFGNTNNRGRFQAKLIVLAKSEFGLLGRSKSNRLMVRKFMRDQMREHGMRPSHIAQNLDVSVSMFFIPSDVDVVAHQVGASNIAARMNELIHTQWESFFAPLGRMLGFSDE
jgi:hypothetical protein